MNEALTRAKAPHDFIVLHGKDHVFDRDSTDPDVMAAFNRAVEFLNARLHPAQTRADGFRNQALTLIDNCLDAVAMRHVSLTTKDVPSCSRF